MPRNTEFDRLAEAGIVFPHAMEFLTKDMKRGPSGLGLAMDALRQFDNDGELAMDAQPALVSAANVGIPAMLTTLVDPEVVRVALSPLYGAKILGESKRGDWTKDTMLFTMIEMTGEVSSYGDFNNNGRAGVTQSWPQRQSYLFQCIIEYGEREMDRAAEMKLQYATELQTSAANALNRFQDYTYHFGVAGLQCYGLLNDPSLTAAMTPAPKANGGTRWINSTGVINANPNEVYADVQAIYGKLIAQGGGNIEMDQGMTLVVDPNTSVALTITNNFNVSVRDLLTKNYPNLKIVQDIRYATTAGNVIQLIADNFNGADTGFCAYPEKLRQHSLIKDLSSMKQKNTSGTWGAVYRYPLASASMIGV